MPEFERVSIGAEKTEAGEVVSRKTPASVSALGLREPAASRVKRMAVRHYNTGGGAWRSLVARVLWEH